MNQSTESTQETSQPAAATQARVYLFLAEKFGWGPDEISKIPREVFCAFCEGMEFWPSKRVPELDVDEETFKRAVRYAVREYLNESRLGRS